MHFAVAPEHLKFFYNNKYIEFENLLTESEIIILSKALKDELSKRLVSPINTFHNTDIKTLYLSGNDLWRDNQIIKKFSLQYHLAEVASNLIKNHPLRIALDQLFISSEISNNLFKKPIPLSQITSIHGVVGGCMLTLSLPSTPIDQTPSTIEKDTPTLSPLSKKIGSGVFFGPNIPLCLDYLVSIPDILQLMIVYTADISLYKYSKFDLHTHTLKNLGYVFGDRLRNTTHPILYRN